MFIIKVSKDFEENLKDIIKNRKSIIPKIKEIKNALKQYWISKSIYEKYNTKKLIKNYYRIKFPPYRIILKFENWIVYLENIFKRKWNNDYKKYN